MTGGDEVSKTFELKLMLKDGRPERFTTLSIKYRLCT